MFCRCCGENGALAGRTYVLELLALIEEPGALPADAARRLGREIMALLRDERRGPHCEAVSLTEPQVPSVG